MAVRFDPLTDGFHFGDTWPLGAMEAKTILSDFESSLAPALAILRPSFHDALELHAVPRELANRVKSGGAEAFGQRAALVYAALDYSNARILPPLRVQFGSTGKAEKVAQFLRRRARESAQATAPALLASATVLTCIPERWVPEALLTAPLRRTIDDLGLFKDAEIELDLKLPFPGGAPWLGRQTRAELEQLTRHLAAGRPWPIVLIPDNGDPFDAPVVLAYRYEPKGQDAGSIHCYDPSLPAKPQTVQVAFGENGTLAGSLSKAGDTFHLKGILCSPYDPAEPPAGFVLHLIHRLWPWKIVWLAWRSLRRWKLKRTRPHSV
jgi:hypothetical protein